MTQPRSVFQGASTPGNMRVVHYDPIKERNIKIVLIIAFFLATASAYWLGGRISDTKATRLTNENAMLVDKVTSLSAEKEQLAQRLAILERTSQVDRQASKNVRVLIRELEDEKARLNKDLTFYKSIMAPEDLNQGIKVNALDLLPGKEANQYRFRLVISQVVRDNSFLKGNLAVMIKGTQDGKSEIISLLELAGLDKSPALGFRYFQPFPNSRDYLTFKLPDNFQPESIEIAVKVRSGRVKSMKKTISWQQALDPKASL